MARVFLRPLASEDIDAIAARIARDNLAAALSFYEQVETTLKLLKVWPNCGALRTTTNPALSGLRSYPIPGFRSYLLFYLPVKRGIDVIRVIHGARNLPEVLGLD
jgi:toxin ParE1/3/4